MTNSEVKKIDYYDGLRGVAALIVFFDHLALTLLPTLLTGEQSQMHRSVEGLLAVTPLAVLWCGHFGVCLFFVLSGLVLALFSSKTLLSIPAQCVRRYLRLIGPILATSFLAWLLLKVGLYYNDQAAPITKSGWLSMWYHFEPNFLRMLKEALIDIFRRGESAYNSNLWTMMIELDASVMIFLFFFIIKQRSLRIFVATSFALLHLKDFYLLFAAGVLIYELRELYVEGSSKAASYIVARGALVILFAVGLYLGSFPDIPDLHTTTVAHRAHMWGAIFVVASLTFSADLQRLFAASVPRLLGRLSFSLYLVHIPILCSLTAGMVLWLRGFMDYYLVVAISGTCTIVVVLILSHLLYRFVDRPSLSFSRAAGIWMDKRFPFPFRTSATIASGDLRSV
jgi:peptidoglycan/LPS O-acetylase OafA/YrhL